jgi:hypothetical protein
MEDENGVSSTSSAQLLVVKMPMLSARFKGGKKRASHALKRKNLEISRLRKHNEKLQKGQNTLRKRLERERKRHRQVIDTPRRKTDSLMKKSGLKPGTRATENIRKKLLYAECISKEVAETSGVNPAEKRLVGKVVSGKIMKKYKMLTELKQSTNITWRTQAKQSKKLDQERRPRNLFLKQKNARDVEEFLCRDDNSRCMHGKADSLKYGKSQKQKRPWYYAKDTTDGHGWQCIYAQCPKRLTTRTIRAGTFFEKSRLLLAKLVYLMYLWSQDTMVKNAAETTGISQKTVVQMYQYFRDVCSTKPINSPAQLGGPGIVVQIHENLFNHKSKYQRGRRPSNETWVFGIVDTSTKLAITYMEAVAKRDKATLL